MRVILALWAEGRTVNELAQAIDGAGRDGHIRKHPQFQTFQTILKDSARVDKYIRLLTVAPTEAPAEARKGRGSAQQDRQLARIRDMELDGQEGPKALP